jgi:hypothetical protein
LQPTTEGNVVIHPKRECLNIYVPQPIVTPEQLTTGCVNALRPELTLQINFHSPDDNGSQPATLSLIPLPGLNIITWYSHQLAFCNHNLPNSRLSFSLSPLPLSLHYCITQIDPSSTHSESSYTYSTHPQPHTYNDDSIPSTINIITNKHIPQQLQHICNLTHTALVGRDELQMHSSLPLDLTLTTHHTLHTTPTNVAQYVPGFSHLFNLDAFSLIFSHPP